MRFVVLANPESNRVSFFQEALSRRGLAPAHVVSWLGLLTGAESLADALADGSANDVCLRIESTGKSFPVERELIARGAGHPDLGSADSIDAAKARALDEDVGRIRFLRQRHLGFLAALDDVARQVDPRVTLMATPPSIALMFDKGACHRRCGEAGVPLPRALPPPTCWDELRASMNAASMHRVFVKPAHSSSASGIVALATQGAKLATHTTVELARDGSAVRLYNSRKIRRYREESDVACIVDIICREGAHVEEWIPKTSLGDKACDLRVVVIGGRAQHAVVRTSKSPLTNLHLLNPRGDLDAFREQVGEDGWARVRAVAEQTSAAVGAPLYAGVDVAVSRGNKRIVSLEANAFGDLLPRVLFEGRNTYAAELESVLP